MKIKHITPMGYCYGVIDAMVIAKNVAKSPDLPRPIYILGMSCPFFQSIVNYTLFQIQSLLDEAPILEICYSREMSRDAKQVKQM